MTELVTLVECPFCGGHPGVYDVRGASVAKLRQRGEPIQPPMYIRCTECGATGPQGGDGTTVELWNHRAILCREVTDARSK